MDLSPIPKRPYLSSRMVDRNSFTWYYAYGNTPAEDLLEQVDFVGAEGEEDPAILALGCGDIRSCFYTLWKHFDSSVSAEHHGRPSGVHFVLNDISSAVIARNILFLYLAVKIPPWTQREAAKQWISSMWAIWYCHELLPIHEETLKEALTTLLKLSDNIKSWEGSQHAISQIVSFTDDGTRAAVRRMWDMWLTKSFGSVETTIENMRTERSKCAVFEDGLNASDYTLVREVQLWLHSIRLSTKPVQIKELANDCSQFGTSGSAFAEDCLGITFPTSCTIVNPTLFEREDGVYSLHCTCTPHDCFHHGLFLSKSQIRMLELDKEVSWSALVVADDAFQKKPLLSNCVQQFSMWVASAAATLMEQVSKKKHNITFAFNCSDCVLFCEELQANPDLFQKQIGFLPLFDVIHTSTLVDHIAAPIIVQVTKQLLNMTGSLLTTTNNAGYSSEEYLSKLFGFDPELFPLVFGIRCVNHDGPYTDTTSAYPKHFQFDSSGLLLASKIFSCQSKTLFWQRVDSQPIMVKGLSAESAITAALHKTACTAIMFFNDELGGGSTEESVFCTETAIRAILSFVSQLDSNVDITKHTFWEGLCALIQESAKLRPFLVHIQTQALLHGLHFHLTLTDSDCPICLKIPLEDSICQFSIEFDLLSMEKTHVFLPEDNSAFVYNVFIHKIPFSPLIWVGSEGHVVDSAQGLKLADRRLQLRFFFPSKFARENYLYTIGQYMYTPSGKIEMPTATLSGELSQHQVSFFEESFYLQQAGIHRTETSPSSLARILNHFGDGDQMVTTLSLFPEPFSLLHEIRVDQVSSSAIQLVCGKYDLTLTYPYSINYDRMKVRMGSDEKGFMILFVPREDCHVYNEKGTFFVSPCHLMTLPTMEIPTNVAEFFCQKQFTEGEKRSLNVKPLSALCDVKYIFMDIFRSPDWEIFEFPPLSADMRPLCVLVHRRACDVVRYSPILDVYFGICEDVALPDVIDSLCNMLQELSDQGRFASKPIDEERRTILEKTLKHCANRTRPSNSDCPPAILTKYGLEKCFRRAILYPLYCDQDYAISMDASVFMLPSYSSENFMSADDSPSPSCSSIASMAFLSESSGIITSSASAKLSCSSYSADCGHILKSVEDGCLCSLCGCNSSVVEKCVICGQTWCYCNECQIQLSEKHKQTKSTEPMDCESKPYLQTRFLHFGSTRPSYVAFGNTEAQDLLEHVGFDNGINEDSPAVLSLGWYVDICSCCYTLWKHFYPPGLISTTAHCSCPGVRFVLNDISKVMVARNILFLYLTMKSPPWTQRKAIKQWISSMWAIWYCHELLPIHKEALEEALDALVSFSDTMESWGGMKENPLRNVVIVTDQSTLSKVRDVWRMWRTSKFGSVKEVLAERAKKLPAPFIAQEGLPPFLMFAVDWLEKTDQFASKGMQDAVTADYIHYVKNGSFFAEECLNIPHLCTSSSVANPTIFEHESGEYTLQTTVLPFRSFHHGLIVTEANLRRFGISHEFVGLSLPLLVEDKSFQSHPILSNSVQQFNIWVFSTAAILKNRGSKANPDITFTFNCSDSIQFCEQLQIKPTSGVLPSHFDAIYTSNLIDRKSPPVILNVTKSLLKNNGHLVAMTMVYRQTAASGEEYLEDVFGYSPELLPVLMGMRCIGHDGMYTDQTSAVPAPLSVKEALIQDFSRSRFDKVFVWQQVNSCPLKISALEKNMALTYTLYVAICNCILAKQEKKNGALCNVIMCTETAVIVILSFVSQLDADVDINVHTFWDGLCSLIQGNKALRRFLVHIQTQALLHGLHFHLTLTETDCPICLKEPIKKFITQFFIEFEPLSSTPMYEGSPTIFLSVHSSSNSPALVFLDKFHSDHCDEVHFIDSAQGQEVSGGKLRLDFFFPISYALKGYYFTVFQDFTFEIGGQSAGSSNPRVTKLLGFCRVPSECESFVFRQADTVRTTRCLSTSLGSVLSHVSDGKKSETTLFIAPEPLSVLKSETANITLEHPSLSTVQVVCDKDTFTMTYPYPIDKSRIKTKVSLTKGTIQIVAQRNNYHVYDERQICFVDPDHLMTLPSLKFDQSEIFNLLALQHTREEELLIYANSRSPMCNAKLSLASCFCLESNYIQLVCPGDEVGTKGYVLINRHAADAARCSPVLDVYYALYEEAVFEEIRDRWTMLELDMASNCSQVQLEDKEWAILKKILDYFASRTRPSNSHSQSSIASLLSKHGLEQYFRRAVLYPLYCNQDFVRDAHRESDDDILSLFRGRPGLVISTTPDATAALESSSSSSRAVRPKALEYHTECSYCGTKSSKLKKCTRCKRTSYCGKQCQTKHWKDHKSVCKAEPDPPTKCSNCDKQGATLKRCAACQVAAYCSKECQRNDWARHKSDCAKK